MYDKLKAEITRILADENELGGPMQRVYPLGVRESLAGSICATVDDLLLQEQEVAQQWPNHQQ